MARLLLAFLLVVAAAAATEDISAEVKAAEKLGDGLPALLKQQWSNKLAGSKKNLTSAHKSLSKKVPAQGASAINALVKVENKIVANLTAFYKKQIKEASQIVKKYDSLLKSRLSSPSTDESAIHLLRKKSQSIVNSWVPSLSQIHRDAHNVFESTLREAATKTASKISDHLLADKTRVAITEAGVQLLNAIVQEQNIDTALLTGKQFGLINDYFQKSETVLIKLLVAAKSKGGQPAKSDSSKLPTSARKSHDKSKNGKPAKKSGQSKPAENSKLAKPKSGKPSKSESSKPAKKSPESSKPAKSEGKKPIKPAKKSKKRKPATKSKSSKPAKSKSSKPAKSQSSKPVKSENSQPAKNSGGKKLTKESDSSKPAKSENNKQGKSEKSQSAKESESSKPAKSKDSKPAKSESSKPAKPESRKPAKPESSKPGKSAKSQPAKKGEGNKPATSSQPEKSRTKRGAKMNTLNLLQTSLRNV